MTASSATNEEHLRRWLLPSWIIWSIGVVPHNSTRTLLLVERYIAVLAAVGVTVLVRGPRIAFWGLHPLLLFELTLGTHNDVLMLLLLAASMRIRRPFFSGVAFGLAAMVKIAAFGALLFSPKKVAVSKFGYFFILLRLRHGVSPAVAAGNA